MNQRKFIRIRSDFVVWYQTIDEDDLSFGRPQAVDISAGGILLEMDEGERIGTLLSMKFKIPNYEKEIKAEGRVVRLKRLETNKFEIGIEFLKISDEDIQAINSLAKY